MELVGLGRKISLVGAIVHYVLEDGPNRGDVRPAIIVRTWDKSDYPCVQLQVFTDGPNDGAPDVAWKSSRTYSESNEPGTWHYMPLTVPENDNG